MMKNDELIIDVQTNFRSITYCEISAIVCSPHNVRHSNILMCVCVCFFFSCRHQFISPHNVKYFYRINPCTYWIKQRKEKHIGLNSTKSSGIIVIDNVCTITHRPSTQVTYFQLDHIIKPYQGTICGSFYEHYPIMVNIMWRILWLLRKICSCNGLLKSERAMILAYLSYYEWRNAMQL